MEQWQENEIKISELYNTESIWLPFGNGPLLDYEEGRHAKSLYDSSKYIECINYMLNTAEKYYDTKEYIAYLLFDCLLGIFLDIVNNPFQNPYVRQKCLNDSNYCLEKSIFLAISLGRIDLLAETAGSLSKNTYIIDKINNLEYAKFLSEFTLCLCNDASDCWQTILALETLIYITKNEGRKELLRKYCKQYIAETSNNPNLAHEINVKQVKKILEELNTDTM